VVELPAGATSSSQQVVLPVTGLQFPSGVVVDAAGDVYVTDELNFVYELPALWATIPGASTPSADSPDISACVSESGCDVTVWWRNGSTNAVDSETSASADLTKSWGPISAVPQAVTSAGPDSQGFYDTDGNYGLFVAWKGQYGGKNPAGAVWWSAVMRGSWSARASIPGSSTEDAPAAFFPYYQDTMFVAWTGTNGDIYYCYGTPGATSSGVDTFSWSAPATIPGASTNAAPAVAEITSGVDQGRIYVFWKGASTDEIWYSWTADPHTATSTWSPQTALTNDGPRTSAGPTAYNEAVTADSVGDIMVAYKGKSSDNIYSETLNSSFAWSPQAQFRGASTTAGPSLGNGLLAETTPSGAIKADAF
jgi:hypothetical protein